MFTLQAAPLKVALSLGEERDAYSAFESTLRQALSGRTDIHVLPGSDSASADLLIAIGAKAASDSRDASIPVLNVMLSRARLNEIRPAVSSRSVGIYIDQPVERQYALLRATLPNVQKIGVLISQDVPELASVRKLTKRTGLILNVQQVQSVDQLPGALAVMLEDSEALLVLPDTNVYRSDTIRNILLGAYRKRVPMIGLSQNYVRAGALCAVYSTPAQIASQAAQAIIQFSKTGKLPADQYPNEFEVAVNRQVAQSLGLDIKSADQLREEIREGK